MLLYKADSMKGGLLRLLFLVSTIFVLAAPDNPDALQSRDRSMSRQNRLLDSVVAKKRGKLLRKEETVITPAGPIPKENVHQVAPNEAVRRNQDGTYSIVPRTNSE
jgi:hypothetical protein